MRISDWSSDVCSSDLFVSSNMHYYGDVESGNIVQQCQVLNPWWLWPAQLFCFNFGATHAIHHFVVSQPFYVRQLTARAAHQVMRDNGVRFNDVGALRRANRRGRSEERRGGTECGSTCRSRWSP